jgi:hypothetical protein
MYAAHPFQPRLELDHPRTPGSFMGPLMHTRCGLGDQGTGRPLGGTLAAVPRVLDRVRPPLVRAGAPAHPLQCL